MDYNAYRRKTRKIKVGSLYIGADAPVSVQSMTNTDTHDIEATYKQTLLLQNAGCDIVRITAPDLESVKTFAELKRRGITTPLVADIHFNHKIAIAAIEAGADTYISGRIGYNVMEEAAEMGINLIEAGHFFTEQHITEFFRELLIDFDPNIYVEIADSNLIKTIT